MNHPSRLLRPSPVWTANAHLNLNLNLNLNLTFSLSLNLKKLQNRNKICHPIKLHTVFISRQHSTLHQHQLQTHQTHQVHSKIQIEEIIHGRKRLYFLDSPQPLQHQQHQQKQQTSPPSSTSSAKPTTSSTPLAILTEKSLTYRWEDITPAEQGESKFSSRNLHGTLAALVPRSLSGWIRATFLPVGFPHSVHPCYARVHWLQALETYMWSIVSVLCSQSMLESLGISSSAATGSAVAIQWVLKDGFGEIGKLFFIQRFARSFDSHPKTWKLVGEFASLVGCVTQLFTLLAPSNWFLPLASIGFALRSIHYSIYNSTHTTFTRNFALQGNVGDIVAKDDSQMTVAHLFGMATGVTLISLSHSTPFIFSTFLIIAPLHFMTTIHLLNATRFEVLTQTNLTLICKYYLDSGDSKKVPGMMEISPHDTRFFGEWIHPRVVHVPKISMGETLKTMFRNEPDMLEKTLAIMKNENYLISFKQRDQSFFVTFHVDAGPIDVMKSIFHISKLHRLLTSAHDSITSSSSSTEIKDHYYIQCLEESKQWTRDMFPSFMAELESKGWMSDTVFWGDSGNRIKWERYQED